MQFWRALDPYTRQEGHQLDNWQRWPKAEMKKYLGLSLLHSPTSIVLTPIDQTHPEGRGQENSGWFTEANFLGHRGEQRHIENEYVRKESLSSCLLFKVFSDESTVIWGRENRLIHEIITKKLKAAVCWPGLGNHWGLSSNPYSATHWLWDHGQLINFSKLHL